MFLPRFNTSIHALIVIYSSLPDERYIKGKRVRGTGVSRIVQGTVHGSLERRSTRVSLHDGVASLNTRPVRFVSAQHVQSV